jgi:arabinogalactan oligomer/maltooligosaccharide transport system permease protein
LNDRAPQRGWCGALLALLIAALAVPAAASTEGDGEDPRPEIVLWHAYRASEAETLEKLVLELNADDKATYRVKLLKVPYDAYLDKLTAAIPRGKGPDVFIAAHDTIGDWAEAKTIQPVGDLLDPSTIAGFHDGLIEPLIYKGEVYGVPLAFKSVALWQNPSLVAKTPKTLSELTELAEGATKEGQYGLVYENGLLYFHSSFLHGFGGKLFDDDGKPGLTMKGTIASVRYAMDIARTKKIVPQEVNGTLVTSLFNEGKAAFIITGPWALGEMDQQKTGYRVSPLPTVDKKLTDTLGGTPGPMRPLLGVEAVMISGQTKQRELATDLVMKLAGPRSAELRLVEGKQPVALKEAWAALDKPGVDKAFADTMRAFRAQLKTAVPTPNTPAMKAMWSPSDLALGESLGQGTDPADALLRANQKLEGVLVATAEGCTEEGKDTFALLLIVIFGGLATFMVFRIKQYGPGRMVTEARNNWTAYLYLAPMAVGMGLLVFTPFVLGVGLGFYKHTWGDWCFVGLSNYKSILLGGDSRFFYTLGITVLWTASNVFLHVTIGLILALILSQARLKYRTLYSVLFIVPWAVPNYITALIWKGMFHPEFGAINAILGLEGFSWMSQTSTAFLANLATNTWLGFPFMMVTAMGGLTAIPKDLYEAAELDGAGPLKRFFSITLPLLRPTLMPAIILGTVWTFNMFNIIYLVSGGAPGGSTDILITEAFRWAFERGQGGAFGYAASYSTMIFLMLLGYSIATDRVSKAVEGSR